MVFQIDEQFDGNKVYVKEEVLPIQSISSSIPQNNLQTDFDLLQNNSLVTKWGQ